MRIVRFVDERGNRRLGQDMESGLVRPLEGDLFGRLTPCLEPMRPARLLSPLEPANIFCIGLNYRGHAEESGAAIPKNPVVFMKPTSAVVGPGDPIHIPAVCSNAEVDYEAELAVVIGREARNVPQSEALDYVLGYTAANDVSARNWQRKLGGGQWIRGKGFDTFCPLGPALVTADEIVDPQNLAVRSVLNGQVMQDHTTGDMIFSVARLICFLSQDTTLLPGTVILTGTPQGVGFTQKPEVWLQPGDEIVVEIEKIGRLVNPVGKA